ncbi:membrane-bound PQQ-dependent dehydrogenase, glucose/quinate/shikimate family [Pseudomaricurvus alcaniphilus]|nr:membrane-bound PQQ-dependent dehydrogenase, glucose/quinate/shikimate family [Pseudomaricurvus alcaniphilus]
MTLTGSVLFAISGIYLLVGGSQLLILNGTAYYLVAGLFFTIVGVLLYFHSRYTVAVYSAYFCGTVIWALLEVGLQFWPLLPRLTLPAVLMLLLLLLMPNIQPASSQSYLRLARVASGGLLLALVAMLVVMFQPQGVIKPRLSNSAEAFEANPMIANAKSDWRAYGHTNAGTRYVQLDQINRSNVHELEVAWTYRTGEVTGPPGGIENQNTPIQVGESLFICTGDNVVHALHAETGQPLWVYDSKMVSELPWQRCRGVSYHQSNDNASLCPERIIMATGDAKLWAINALTGKVCTDFGDQGAVNLRENIGRQMEDLYTQTSAPLIANNIIVVGGMIVDNQSINEPSGVIRGFDVLTGELIWAWDLGNPSITKLPPEGETYTEGTPNAWTTLSFDAELGLVYVPLGNATPDYWGGDRSPEMEAYTDALVALDISTGRERWKFQTVHHDLWDFDLASQPGLYDIPDGKGGILPAVVQATKVGQIFVLDRRTGKPLTKVEEKPVPQGVEVGEWLSPTQPFSTGMPALGNEVLSETDMWGATLFDQLLCRIAFKKLNYAGMFTPITTEPGLGYPSNYGGMNWGSVAINGGNDYLIVNDIRMPMTRELLTQNEISQRMPEEFGEGDAVYPQSGTPYGLQAKRFFSPLGIPCKAPPYGAITAIDLKTQKIVWQHPLGSLKDTALAGIKIPFEIPVGMPSLSGPMTTAGDLVFFAGTTDYFLRAMDLRTGETLWKGRLPVGSQGTPMTYTSGQNNRQFVVVSAGGARESSDRGDYIIAYALPE